ncbi:recombinase family protein [Streptomyces sp. NPDC088358]|uniref:recombinase family protein n=1 Tax=Streptomyces sp. NPDC088358 TaxID=3365857 RepID=UPI00380C5697
MLKAMGEIRHVVVYRLDRLMRQPKDLEELLSIADDKRVLLHGEANRRDLSAPTTGSSCVSRWLTHAALPTTRLVG